MALIVTLCTNPTFNPLPVLTLYFPYLPSAIPTTTISAIVLGQQGVYAGLDDLWLERASGQLIVNCIPHQGKDPPRIQLLLSNSHDVSASNNTSQTGSAGTGNKGGGGGEGKAGDGDAGGLTVRIKAEGFRLAGESLMTRDLPHTHLSPFNTLNMLYSPT